jgi:TetR/AcrR family transcriptional repressor of nem operon
MPARTAAARAQNSPTATRILDAAEELAQVRGFNGFSYADVASRLQITNASLHYHFPGKADLGAALIGRYRERFARALQDAERDDGDAVQRLAAYARLYEEVFSMGRMCLCGMLAAEYETLPGEMQEMIVAFFDENERWLVGVLEAGRSERTLTFDGPPREQARSLIGSLEGAMLVARLRDDADGFSATASHLVASLAGEPPRARGT